MAAAQPASQLRLPPHHLPYPPPPFHPCFHPHRLLPLPSIPFYTSPCHPTLDSSLSYLPPCSSAPFRTAAASVSPPQRGSASNAVSADIPCHCAPMSVCQADICDGFTHNRPDNVFLPIASTADAPSAAAFLPERPPACSSRPFSMPGSCPMSGPCPHGSCFPKFMPFPVAYPCWDCGMWNYCYFLPCYPFYTGPLFPQWTFYPHNLFPRKIDNIFKKGSAGCMRADVAPCQSSHECVELQHGDLHQLQVDTETCPADDLPNREMVDTCKKGKGESIGTIRAAGASCQSNHKYIGGRPKEFCQLQVDKEKLLIDELPDRCEAEEHEEADDGLQFVLTDEWVEFFAKSEARRHERKQQQKKDAKAARRVSKSIVKDQAV